MDLGLIHVYYFHKYHLVLLKRDINSKFKKLKLYWLYKNTEYIWKFFLAFTIQTTVFLQIFQIWLRFTG